MEAPLDTQENGKGQGHLPPQNIEAEQRVLGAILLDGGEGSTVASVMEVLRPEHCYRPSHRVIFEAMIVLFERSDPIDILTVVDALKKIGKLDEAGGQEYVARLSDDVSSARRAVAYAKLVRATYLARSLIRTSNAIAERAFSDQEPLAAAHLHGPEVELEVDLGTGGNHAATIWTCDLSAEYVRINADYRT